ncbi:MAG: hypothetical protein HGGPFJEG_00565 [Ignavibacteria bacterium]|nr:hypothetical protein [Ignavibacteria bacterium]
MITFKIKKNILQILLTALLFGLILPEVITSQEINDSAVSFKIPGLKSERLFFETEYPEQSDAVIRDHLTDLFPIISEKEIQKIIDTKEIIPLTNINQDTAIAGEELKKYKVTFEVPENFLADTAKILWVLNIPEFNSRIYQLYNGKEIYIDTWPNVIGTIKDKTYTGNFSAYKIRNWPFYKDPEPNKAHLPPVKPGPGNPLGLFVVHYDENSLRYFHGTNKPNLLGNKMRNLSHGCVRNDNDNIEKMKQFIIKRVVKSADLSDWLGSKKTLIYNFEEQDKFPVQIIYKTYDVNTDESGNYIILFDDIYKYGKGAVINTEHNDEGLITLASRDNIISEYREKFGKDIPDEALNLMVDYVLTNGKEYEKYYIEDLKAKFMVRN